MGVKPENGGVIMHNIAAGTEVLLHDGGDWESKHAQRVKEEKLHKEGGLAPSATAGIQARIGARTAHATRGRGRGGLARGSLGN
jgi:hypothetical protein